MSRTTTTIVDVGVVDTHDGALVLHQDVTLTEGQISSITSTDGRAVSGRTADGRGRFLVPGYVDMHAHPLNGERPDVDVLSLMLAHGIPAFRQMAGSPDLLKSRRLGDLDLGPTSPASSRCRAPC